MAPAVPHPETERPAVAPELLKQIAVFRFCEDELRRRAANSVQPWVWDMKGKVAAFCRGSLERHLPDDEPPADCILSDQEARDLLQAHPLLSAPALVPSTSATAPVWLRNVRLRIREFLSSARQGRETSAP